MNVPWTVKVGRPIHPEEFDVDTTLQNEEGDCWINCAAKLYFEVDDIDYQCGINNVDVEVSQILYDKKQKILSTDHLESFATYLESKLEGLSLYEVYDDDDVIEFDFEEISDLMNMFENTGNTLMLSVTFKITNCIGDVSVSSHEL